MMISVKESSKLSILRVHSLDSIGRSAVQNVLDKNHGKRFKQDVLDFYRHGCSDYLNLSAENDVLFVVGLIDAVPIGLSCLALDATEAFSSLTVVSKAHQHQGIGTTLLSAKMAYMKRFYTNVACRTFVNNGNLYGLAMCISAGLNKVGEGSRRLTSGERSCFSIFEPHKKV